MGKGSYLGGHTVIGPGSGWFSKPKTKRAGTANARPVTAKLAAAKANRNQKEGRSDQSFQKQNLSSRAAHKSSVPPVQTKKMWCIGASPKGNDKVYVIESSKGKTYNELLKLAKSMNAKYPDCFYQVKQYNECENVASQENQTRAYLLKREEFKKLQMRRAGRIANRANRAASKQRQTHQDSR